jgi:glycosyltransferase involved in cell wall biosynthesis
MKLINNPLVSVVINCYNGEKYLRQSIESVLDQSYQNFELIFWDNQSTDQSKNIIQSYQDKRIKYFYSQNHTTLYEARNLALQKCNGQFVCFLDVDDWYESSKIEDQIIFFSDKDVGVVYSNRYTFYNNLKIQKIYKNSIQPSGYIRRNILANYQVSFMTTLIRMESLKNLDYVFDKNYSIIGDFDLIYRLSLTCKFIYITKPLGSYRIHDNNLSKNNILFIYELQRWYSTQKDLLSQEKKYISEKILYLKSIELIYDGKRIESFTQLSKFSFGYYQLKLFIILFLPLFLLKIIKKYKY